MAIDRVATLLLLEKLQQDVCTQKQLQELTGLCNTTVGTWLRELKRKEMIYISEWHKHGRVWVAYYSWGYKETDARKPRPLTMKEREQRRRDKNRFIKLYSSIVGAPI